MKTLVLSPLNYPSIRQDLVLMNYNENVYSNYYAFEGMFAVASREDKKLESSHISMLLHLADNMTEREYNSSDIFYGLVPKKFPIDRVICYNYDVLSSQEALLSSYFLEYANMFYSTADITDKCDNIMEAIKLAQSTTADSD